MDLSSLREGLDLREDDRARNAASRDAGFIVIKKPHAVVLPKSADEVSQVVQWANQSDCPISFRGTGHTHGGQALTDRGIVVNMRSLNRIGDIEGEAIWVQGGVMWHDLVAHVLPRGYLPKVLTNNLGTTVGGTIATGGLGRSTHHYGVQSDNVEEMQLVTGSGEILSCSRTENRELFDGTRGGLGQFSIITEARIPLRKVAPKVRTFCLMYDDLKPLMKDLESLLFHEQFMHLRGWWRHQSQQFGLPEDEGPAGQEWYYPLHASVEFGDEEPDADELLKDLNYARLVRTEDQAPMDFADMLEATPHAALRRIRTSGLLMAFPVTEGLIPWSTVQSCTEQLADSFPPALLPYCNFMLRPVRNDLIESPMLMAPKQGLGMGFGIVPHIPPIIRQQGIEIAENAGHVLTSLGGKRYLTGWVNFDHAQWQAHYEDLWPQILEWKARFDPKGILNPGFIHYQP